METKDNGFFMPIANVRPYLKIGIEGEAGSGKSWTMLLIMVGLHQRIKSTKPIVLLDTEQASKFFIPALEKANIKAVVRESRTLPDFRKAVEISQSGYADIMMIDSATHLWEEFLKDWTKKIGRKLEMRDYAQIHPAWKEAFSDVVVNARLHIGFTGRVGSTYEMQEIDGKKQMVATGQKMRAGKETAYEPDLLVYMDRFEELIGKDRKKKNVWREATILKDRSQLIDGQTFKNPTYKNFSPVVDLLLRTASAPVEVAPSTPNSDLIPERHEENGERAESVVYRERIDALLTEAAPGNTKEEKLVRLALMKYAFVGETSDAAVERMSFDQLLDAHTRLKPYVEAYTWALKAETKLYGQRTAVVAQARHAAFGDTLIYETELDTLREYCRALKAELSSETTQPAHVREG